MDSSDSFMRHPRLRAMRGRYGAAVHFGITMFATDQTIDVGSLAQAAEARGFHSLYIPEHTHIPTSRRTPPAAGGGVLAEEYKRTLDPLVALSAAAAVTERIQLGTGICVVAQREPIVTAKAIATLDGIAAGRFVLGVGFGWNADEIEHHGITMPNRREVAREHVLAMRALWRDDIAEFHGQHVDFSPSWSWPKPVRPEGPPVLIGGAPGPTLFAHVAEYADGWIPIGGAGIRAALDDLRRACDAVDRDADTLRIVPFGTIPDPGKLDYYASLGIREIVLRIPGGTADGVLPILDEYAALIG
jgi:probable F420-dependent oxidoreductase